MGAGGIKRVIHIYIYIFFLNSVHRFYVLIQLDGEFLEFPRTLGVLGVSQNKEKLVT